MSASQPSTKEKIVDPVADAPFPSASSGSPASVAPSSGAASEAPSAQIASTSPSEPRAQTFATASHAALFGTVEEPRCDVCGEAVGPDTDEGYAVPGSGLYLWSRGDELRVEEPPLCPSCAAAIGVSALAGWEIEEEEG